jgi:phosphate starvation-inducible PhoH-like protein
LKKSRRAAKEQQHVAFYDNNLIQLVPETKKKQIKLNPRNLNQEFYIENLLDWQKTIVFAIGPAGTGKTLLAVQAAVQAFLNQEVDKIVLTRPAVTVDEDHGFLPGTLNEKMEPWTKPIFDVFQDYWSTKQIGYFLEHGKIEVSPLAYMRGRTLKRAWVIADEMQNATVNQMKMLLTRIGEDSRMVVTGDLQQGDRLRENGLEDFARRASEFSTPQIAFNRFDHRDIERHPAVEAILKIYGDC